MNINRHNYEEFFLLYIDKELGAEERAMVETFVAANPDLKEELELLQQTTFTADPVVDPQLVQSLLKVETEESSISEELLLLHLDKELSAQQTAEVEQALQKDEQLQKEFRWLQRSQLTADETIVFPDKSILYRESQPARVFYLGTAARRWAAAAAVIVLLASGMWLMNNKQENNNNLAVAKPETQSSSSTVPKVEQQNNNQPAETKKYDVSTEPQKQDLAVAAVNKHTTNTTATTGNHSNNTQTNSTQTQTPVVTGQEIAVTQPVLTTTENNSTTNSNIQETVNVPPVTNTANKYASYASYNEDNDNQEEDNGVLNEERQRSTGLKGLLKKAKRTIERRTGIHTGDSQVRFAMFAVNTQ